MVAQYHTPYNRIQYTLHTRSFTGHIGSDPHGEAAPEYERNNIHWRSVNAMGVFLVENVVFPVENACLSTILNGRQQTTCNDLAGETECQDYTPNFFSTKLLVSLRNILENIGKKKHLRSCSTWPLALLWITQVVGKMGVKTTNIRNAGCNSSYLRPLGAIVSHFEHNYRCLPEPPTAEIAMDNNPKMGKKDQLWMPE